MKKSFCFSLLQSSWFFFSLLVFSSNEQKYQESWQVNSSETKSRKRGKQRAFPLGGVPVATGALNSITISEFAGHSCQSSQVRWGKTTGLKIYLLHSHFIFNVTPPGWMSAHAQQQQKSLKLFFGLQK